MLDRRQIPAYAMTGAVSFVLGVVITTLGSTHASPAPRPAVTRTVTAPGEPTPSQRPAGTLEATGDWTPQEWASAFKAFTAKHGNAHQKSAVAHVVKIKGLDGNAEDWNAPDDVGIYTDIDEDSDNSDSQARLILDALTDWQQSRDGDLSVVVYAVGGGLLELDSM
ncbi:hypothetical protein [Streptomyces sp. NPDC002265]|uniref:hypothetical protein n=1 Tax=Streptomyces sp. NPDC002265 TaxID=3154415 RepID=UPI00331B1F3D